MRNRQAGVTLIELITVMLVVALLGAIAIPSYRSYMIRTKRTDAKTALMSAAGALERCYTRLNSYKADDGCTAGNDYFSENQTYKITIETPTALTFLATATPQGTQADDTACSNFTINQVGVKGVSGTKTVPECWGK